jgi:hypothetical protein
MIRRRRVLIVALLALFPTLVVGIALAGSGAAGQRPDPTYLHRTDASDWERLVRSDAGLTLLDTHGSPPLSLRSPQGPPRGDLFGFPPTIQDVGSWPEALAIGDVNDDGLNDVVMTTFYGPDPGNDYHLFVFTQNEQGGLSPAVKYATGGSYTTPPRTVDVGDVNNDGRNDVVIGNMRQDIRVFLQNAVGTLEPPAIYNTDRSLRVRIADLNDDDLLDVAGLSWGTDDNLVSVFLQNAGGTLDSQVNYTVEHGGYDDLEVGDVNDDGLSDIIVMSGQLYAYDNLGILLQNGAGTFDAAVYYDLGGDQLTHGLAVGDVNGDLLNDVVVTYGGNTPTARIAAFLQNQSGTLDPALSYATFDVPEPVEIADVNGDQRQDVVVAHGGWYSVTVALQDGAGALLPYELYWVPYASHYNPHGLDVGDLNNDGNNDIALADYNHGLVILYYREILKAYLPMIIP